MTSEHPSSRRTVRTLAWASFLHDLGGDMIFSVWPIFLTQVLGANKTAVGLVDGLGDAVVSFSSAFAGYLSDRLRKRKVFVWIGYAFGAVARIGYAIAPSWILVIPFRILDRSGKIRTSPRDAIVSDISNHGNRGAHFGWVRMMDNAGAIAGVLLSLALLRLVGLRTIFLLAVIPSLFASLLVITQIREKGPASGAIFRGVRFGDVGRNLRIFIVSSAILEFAVFSYSFLMLAAVTAGFSPALVPLLYLLFTFVAAVVSFPVGRIADGVGRKPLIVLSVIAWMAVNLIFLTSWHPVLILLAFVLFGLHKGMLDTVQKTLVAELASKEFVASTLGGFQLIIGIVSLPSSLVAGFLWDTQGVFAPFALSLVLAVLSLILLLFVRERRR